MTTVRIVDGMKYGFRYLAVLVGVLLLSGAFLAGGGALAYSGLNFAAPLRSDFVMVGAGGLVALVGLVAFHGMLFGLLYKFVADSVVAGVEAADISIDLSEDATITVEDQAGAIGAGAAPTAAGAAGAAESGATDAGDSVEDEASASTDADGPGSVAGDSSGDPTVEGTVDEGSEPAGDPATGRASEPTAEAGGPADEDPVSGEPTGEELDRVVSEATDPTEEERVTSTTLFEDTSSADEGEQTSEDRAGSGEYGPAGDTEPETTDTEDLFGQEEGRGDVVEGSEPGGEGSVAEDGVGGSGTDDATPDAATGEAGGADPTGTPSEDPDESVTRPDDGTDTDLLDMSGTGEPADPTGSEDPEPDPLDREGAGTDEHAGEDHVADTDSLEDPDAGPSGGPDEDVDDAGAPDDPDSVMDEAFEEAEEATNPIDELDDSDVEDTTDEEGDWEPLDESDLRD